MTFDDGMRDTTHDAECWRYHDGCALVQSVELPIRTVSEANIREHWGAKARRAKKQRADVLAGLLATGWPRPSLPLVVTLTRIGPRRRDDDNNVRSLKACRDSVAAWLKVDDGNEQLEWRYAQIVGPPAAVLIEIRGPK